MRFNDSQHRQESIIVTNKHFKDSTNPIPSSSSSSLIPPSPFQHPDSTNARMDTPPSAPQWLPESRTPSIHYPQQHTFYPERTGQTQIVRFLKDRKGSQRGGQTTRMRHFLVLVERVLVHRTTRFQVAELARNRSHVLLELFSTTHHLSPSIPYAGSSSISIGNSTSISKPS